MVVAASQEVAAEISVDKVVVSGFNPRRGGRTKAALRELADSIRAVGVIEPLIVRSNSDGTVHIVVGERRWRAAKQAGLSTVPCITRDYDDQQALEVAVIENLQREGLHPLEEAEGIQALYEQHGWNLKTIANQIGRSTAFVARRARLATLIKPLQKMAVDPASPLSRWSASHWELIAKLDKSGQELLYEERLRKPPYYYGNWHVADLEGKIHEMTCLISSAPFKPSDAELVPKAGACLGCLKRSSCNPGLFDNRVEISGEDMPKGDRCLDAVCWRDKVKTHITQREAALREEHGDKLVLISEHTTDREDLLVPWDYEPAKKSDKGSEPAMVVEGNRPGRVQWIKRKTDASGQPRSKKGKKRSMKERENILYRRRVKALTLRGQDLLEELEDLPSEADTIAALVVFGTSTRDSEPGRDYYYMGPKFKTSRWEVVNEILSQKHSLRELAWEQLKPVLHGRLNWGGSHADEKWLYPECHRVLQFMGWGKKEIGALWAMIVKDIPEPASWAKERARAKEVKANK